MSDEYLTETEVAAATRIPVNTLRWYRHKNDGGPRWFRLGGRRVLYARSDVEAWIDTARKAGVGA